MSKQYTNIAFISYKREDEKWAKWLQNKLEHYQLPIEIRKQKVEFAERPRHVFKDTTDLSGGVGVRKEAVLHRIKTNCIKIHVI